MGEFVIKKPGPLVLLNNRLEEPDDTSCSCSMIINLRLRHIIKQSIQNHFIIISQDLGQLISINVR